MEKQKTREKSKQTTFYLDEDKSRRFKIALAMAGLSMQSMIETAIDEFISQVESGDYKGL